MTDYLLTNLAKVTDPAVERVERFREVDAKTDLLIVYFNESDGRDPLEVRIRDSEWNLAAPGHVFYVTDKRLRTALDESPTA